MLVSSESLTSEGRGLIALRGCFEGIRPSEPKVGECANGLVDDSAAMVENLLKLGRSFVALM
jgi:hypothetical protein